MTLEQLSYISQIVGVLLVVASLIYLARQVNQNTEVMRAESRSDIYSRHMEELYAFLGHPNIFREIGLANEDTPDAAVQAHAWLTAHFRGREHEWFQFQHGALDHAAWLSYSSSVQLLLGSEQVRAWWEVMKAAFDAEFASQIDMLVEGPSKGNLNHQAMICLLKK